MKHLASLGSYIDIMQICLITNIIIDYGSMILFEITLHHNQKGWLIKVKYCNGHVEIDKM
jgi:hypothetical protein